MNWLYISYVKEKARHAFFLPHKMLETLSMVVDDHLTVLLKCQNVLIKQDNR